MNKFLNERDESQLNEKVKELLNECNEIDNQIEELKNKKKLLKDQLSKSNIKFETCNICYRDIRLNIYYGSYCSKCGIYYSIKNF